MIAKIFVGKAPPDRVEVLKKELTRLGLKLNHPDLLYIASDEKLGVQESKKISEFLSFKPFSGKIKGVVLEAGDNLTPQAQNSLLKILEELPENVFFLIGAKSEEALLPTIKSRCEVVFLESRIKPPKASLASSGNLESRDKFLSEIERLEEMTLEQRFLLIEKIDGKDQFLEELIYFYRQKLLKDPKYLDFSKKLLQAEEFHKHNVNLRGILEYLMLSIPTPGVG